MRNFLADVLATLAISVGVAMLVLGVALTIAFLHGYTLGPC